MPNRYDTDAVKFLTELGRDLNPEERLIVSFPPECTKQMDSDANIINYGWRPEPWKPGDSLPETLNSYVVISASKKTPRPKDGVMRYWRGEASYSAGLAIMVDDLAGTTAGIGSKGKLTIFDIGKRLKPTVCIETSPNNYQIWYFLDRPERDGEKFQNFLVSFVDFVLAGAGGDITVKDVARYGRLPIGYNNKRLKDGTIKYGGKYGCPVKLFSANYELRYSMEEIAAAFGFKIRKPRARKKMDSDAIDAIWYDMAKSILSKAKAGERTGGDVWENGSGKCRIECPWGDEHGNGDPSGAYFRGPVLGARHDFVFGCAHDACRQAGRTWSPFVDKVVMPFVEDELAAADAYWMDVPDAEAISIFLKQ